MVSPHLAQINQFKETDNVDKLVQLFHRVKSSIPKMEAGKSNLSIKINRSFGVDLEVDTIRQTDRPHSAQWTVAFPCR
jgi:hypothetical protein